MAVYVEDLVLTIAGGFPVFSGLFPDPWYEKFIYSVSDWVTNDKPLTSEQAKKILSMANRCSSKLVSMNIISKEELDAVLTSPKYRHPLKQSVFIKREARYLGNNMIGLRFKRHDDLSMDIKKLKRKYYQNYIEWDNYNFIWAFEVSVETLEPLMNLLLSYKFDLDDDVFVFLDNFSETIKSHTCEFKIVGDKIVVSAEANILLRKWVDGQTFGTFELPATGNVARRILKLGRYNKNIVYDDGMLVIASKDRIDHEQFSSFANKNLAYNACQELLDFDLRAILPIIDRSNDDHNMFCTHDQWSAIIAYAAKERGIKNVTMINYCYRKLHIGALERWCNQLGLNYSEQPTLLHPVVIGDDAPEMPNRNETLLIYVTETYGGTISSIVHEYQHSLVLCEQKQIASVNINPYMPNMERIVGNAQALRSSGFQQSTISSMAILYNVALSRLGDKNREPPE